MRPESDAAGFEIIRIGYAAARGEIGPRLLDAIGEAVALGIGDRLLLGREFEPYLLAHVAGARPTHQRLDAARQLRLEVEAPQVGAGAGLSGARGG